MKSLKLPSICKSASQAGLSKMQLTLQIPHGASRLVRAMSAWSSKTGYSLSRHCRDARVTGLTAMAMHECRAPPPWSVKSLPDPSRHCRHRRFYGHATTAMHDMSTPPPSRLPPLLGFLCVIQTHWERPSGVTVKRQPPPPHRPS